MAKDFFGRLEETIQTTGKAAAQKAKEVADSAKRHNDLRVAKRDLNDLYRRWERSILKNIWITHRQSILTCLI